MAPKTIWIVGPFLRKIQRAIDERMAMTRNVGSEDADLAIGNLPCRTSVLRATPHDALPVSRLSPRRKAKPPDQGCSVQHLLNPMRMMYP